MQLVFIQVYKSVQGGCNECQARYVIVHFCSFWVILGVVVVLHGIVIGRRKRISGNIIIKT